MSGALPRRRLFRLLDQSRQRPVIWVCGPPGAGKTTLVASYLRARRRPCLWYQLDEGDGDPGAFFHYLSLAAEQAAPPEQRVLPHFAPEYFMGMQTFARRFFEALYDRLSLPAFVVFDDYQEVKEGASFHELFAAGLRVIPEGLTVVVISRHEPPPWLAALRAGGNVKVIGWPDLQLDVEESMGIARLRDQKRKARDPCLIHRLHERTQGWAAGLILMLEQVGSEDMEADPVGGQPPEVVFDYFATEMIKQVDTPTRNLLLKTAALPRIRAATARRLTGIPQAGQILNDLCRRQFFTIRQMGAEPVYEYHPLFRSFLLAQARAVFPPEEWAALLHASAGWLEKEGQPQEAAVLYQKAGDWQALSGLILREAPSLIGQGRYGTLEGWLRSLPAMQRESDPWLLFWLGSSRQPFDLSEARGCYEMALEGFQRHEDVTGLYLSWSGIVETFVLQWDDFAPLDRWIAVLEELQARHPAFPSLQVEARVTALALAGCMYRQPDHPQLARWAERAERLIRQPIDLSLRMGLAVHLSLYNSWMGRIARFDVLMRSLPPDPASPGIPPFLSILGYCIQAVWGWNTATWEVCEPAIRAGLEVAERTGVHVLDIEVLSQGVYCCASVGQVEAAEAYLRQLAPLVVRSGRLSQGHYHYVAGLVALVKQDLKLAREHASLSLRCSMECGAPIPVCLSRLSVAHLLFMAGERHEATVHLDEALSTARRIGSLHLEYHGRCLQAHFAAESGREQEEILALRQAMALGNQGGLVNLPWLPPDLMARLCMRALERGIETDYVQSLIRKRRFAPGKPASLMEQWPWPVKLYTLGRFSLLRNGRPVRSVGKAQKKPLDLLKALLALGGREVIQEQLMEALWPEAEGDAAYRAFITTLQRLRKLLGHKEVLPLSDGKLTLDARFCWVDCWAFERLLGPGGMEPARLEKGLALYQGAFLEKDHEAAWALSIREQLRLKFLRGVETLGAYWEQQGQWSRAIECYERGLAVDDLAEAFYQRLMTAHLHLGRRGEALAVYRRCRNTLSHKLSVNPSPETEALHRRLRRP